MRYGKQIAVMAGPNGIITYEEEKYANWDTVRKLVQNTETIQVKNDDQVLAEFLKLLDLHKDGEARDINFCCKVDDENNIIRIEKSWIVQDLKEPSLKARGG